MESIYESQVDPLRPNDAHGISLQLVGQGKHVLELGAASGHVTRALKSLNNTVTAIERDGRFASQLSEFADDVIITDLDWLDLRDHLNGQKFDVVLAGDVLEHCSRPELVLLQLHDLLNPNGYIVISLPNIAHGDVRLALLAGEFNYRDTGLLDRTHVRFFTRSSIDEFLTSNNFKVEEIFASTANIGTTEFGAPKAGVPVEAIQFVQQDHDALVYQYVVRATPLETAKRDAQAISRKTSDDSNVEKLLAEVSMYQELVVQKNTLSQQNLDLYYQALTENADSQRLIEQLQIETNSANFHVHDMQQKCLEYLQVMETNRQENADMHNALLVSRDHAIGTAAELGELRFRYEKTRQELDSVIHQLNILHGSRTWRIGRFMLLPLRALRKILRLIAG